MATKQKDAVFEAIAAVKGTNTFAAAVELSKDERGTVMAAILAGLNSGNIEFGGDLNDKGKLTAYVSGLVSNWLRKDKRLNGNTTYVPANPGTRTGGADDAVKAMRTLLSVTDDETAKKEIQEEIEKRVAALKPKPEINVAALPDSLKHLAANGEAVLAKSEVAPVNEQLASDEDEDVEEEDDSEPSLPE